ncbi:DUF4412 domain-containing protein [Solitalea koreensis]|uniref:DUF4412 domain-containing protein n=1 Tax=Solitalea koreensis TaxID=543615 RepID=A0A521CKB9_9SPHI|nr:DUF4412 domain-containing protein [Solitalea koreensis]SMO59903.1 protein of unknown function [Solitalea koreensis]
MKRPLLFLLTTLLISNAAKAQSNFEGSFKMIISGEKLKHPAEIMYYIKDQKICSVINNPDKGGQMRMIIDPATSDILMLMDMNGKKMGMKSKMKDIAEMAEQSGMKTDVKITETNETKTIDGHPCKKIIAETEDSTIDMWVAQDMDLNLWKILASMRSAKGPMGGARSPAGDFAKYSAFLKGPSLESIITHKKTGDKTTMQIKDIQKGNIDAAMFDTAGYQMMDMPEIGKKE